jgi:hypothetical protein
MFFVDDGNIAATFDVMLRAIQFEETEFLLAGITHMLNRHWS